MFSILIIIFLLVSTESFVHKLRFSTSTTKIFKNNNINDNINDLGYDMTLNSKQKPLKIIMSSIIASSLLFSVSNIAYADLGDDDITSTTPISVTNGNGPKPITVKTRTISTKDSSSSSSSLSSSSSGSGSERDYQASLVKEKNKASAIKSKTKEEKRRDLCEALGRGC